MTEEIVDIAIVGAGISGLAAARRLAESGVWNYKIYEASERVGGRTFVDSDGTDLGGAYFGPTQDNIMGIIDELGLKLRKVNTKGKTVQNIDGKIVHYEGTIPPVSFLGALDLNSAIIKISQLCDTLDMNDPHLSPNSDELDRMTGEQLLCSMVWTKDSMAILRTAIRAILCVEPCQISALYLIWYIAQSGGPNRIFETENGAQDSKVVGGAGQIAPLLAAKYAHNKLRVNCPIRTITSADESADVELVSGDLIIRAKYVILAIPPIQQLRIEYTTPLSGTRFQSLQRWPMGCICKTFVYYETNFWKDKDLNGTLVSDNGIVCVSYCDTQEDGTKPCIMGFCLAHEATREMTSEERRNEICQHYAACFQTEKALHSIGYKEKLWSEEQWVGGCYVGTVGPGVLTSCKLVHTQPLYGKIYVAGTESARHMIGYMDGAAEAGERCARNVLVKLGLLDNSLFDVVVKPKPSLQLPFKDVGISAVDKLIPSVSGLLLFGTIIAVVAVAVAVTHWQ